MMMPDILIVKCVNRYGLALTSLVYSLNDIRPAFSGEASFIVISNEY
jgi:hypothetical protein